MPWHHDLALLVLGPTLRRWRTDWAECRAKSPTPGLPLPGPLMTPLGYVVMHSNRYIGAVTRASQRWLQETPAVYRQFVLDQEAGKDLALRNDPYCLAVVRYFPSLMLMARMARKPTFKLTPADGAIGAHAPAVREVAQDLRSLAKRILDQVASPAGTPQ